MKYTLFSHKYRYLFIMLLGIYSYLNILFTDGHKLFEITLPDGVLLLVLLLIVLVIWEGNRLIFRKINHLNKPLIPFFLLSLGLVLLISMFTAIVVIEFFDPSSGGFYSQGKIVLAFTFRVNLFLHAINGVYFYSNKFRKMELEAEKLRTQNAEYHYEALRNQVNPHFLFNSFSVLESIIYKNKDKASAFIKELSRVYRYFLYHQKNKTVPLEVELEFIQSYLYLYQIRFEGQIVFHNNLPADLEEYYVPPGSLQILIENCLKHNQFSIKAPIHITVNIEEKDYLIVKNNYNLKKIPESSNKMGLENLKQRYRYITNRPVIINAGNGDFIVKIPLIKEWER